MSKPFGEELLFQKAEAGTLRPDEQRKLAKRGRERLSRMAGWCEENVRLKSEIARLRLTEAEREAVEWAEKGMPQSHPHAATLRGLLERLGGEQ